MSHPSKTKGDRVEREICVILNGFGIKAERTYLAKQAARKDPGDIVIEDDLRAEVKARSNGEGFATLERWKGDNDILFLRRDRKSPLVLMDMSLFCAIAKKYYGKE